MKLQNLSEKAMNNRTYKSSFARLDGDIRIGFEFEFLVPKGSLFWEPLEQKQSEAVNITQFDSMREFEEFFHVTTHDERSIDYDYGAWVAEKQDEYADEHWHEYDDDEKEGRSDAIRDFSEPDWQEWFNEVHGSAASFVDHYGLTPLHGWCIEGRSVFRHAPEDASYHEAWKDTATAVAESLGRVLKEKVRINEQDGWHIYQDTSIKDGGLHGPGFDSDMQGYGIELVSPPLMLTEALKTLDLITSWMDRSGIETNTSTGLHINMSTSDIENIDPVKLLLFMGESHVLREFDRVTNAFTQSHMRNVIDMMHVTGKIPKSLDELKNLAWAAIMSTTKQWSVNFSHLKSTNKYLEFRAPGGPQYHENLNKLKDTVGRFAYVLEIACSPEAEKKEYIKKLAKLLNVVQDTVPK